MLPTSRPSPKLINAKPIACPRQNIAHHAPVISISSVSGDGDKKGTASRRSLCYFVVLPKPPVRSPSASSSSVMPKGRKIPCANPSPPTMESVFPCRLESVSYTHLDVYKRQVQDGLERHAYGLEPVHSSSPPLPASSEMMRPS